MKVKKSKILGILSLLLILSSCASNTNEIKFNVHRAGNDEELILLYRVLNQTISQELTLKKSDKVISEIDNQSGKIAVEFLNENKDKVFKKSYKDEKDNFTFEVPEDGKYIIAVTGKDAKGSVSFLKE